MSQGDEQKLREKIEEEIKSKMNIKERIRGIALDIMTVIILLLSIFGVLYIVKNLSKDKNNNIPETTVNQNIDNKEINIENIKPEEKEEAVKEQTDFEKYNSNLYKKTPIYLDGIETPDNYIQKDEEALTNAGRKIKITGEIEDAYIYIKAGANDEKGNFTSIMKEYDGVWFYLMNGHFLGGQLDLSESKFGQPSELTELLYNIKKIPVAKNLIEYKNKNFKTLDLLNELKDERFIGALVSTERYGKIIDLTIGYKCRGEVNSCKIISL